jgi:hypothetical protein
VVANVAILAAVEVGTVIAALTVHPEPADSVWSILVASVLYSASPSMLALAGVLPFLWLLWRGATRRPPERRRRLAVLLSPLAGVPLMLALPLGLGWEAALWTRRPIAGAESGRLSHGLSHSDVSALG